MANLVLADVSSAAANLAAVSLAIASSANASSEEKLRLLRVLDWLRVLEWQLVDAASVDAALAESSAADALHGLLVADNPFRTRLKVPATEQEWLLLTPTLTTRREVHVTS